MCGFISCMMQKTDNDNKIPAHIAIIPDGNRRWAKENGFPNIEGHRAGAKAFEKMLDFAKDMGVKAVTGWFFSTENWTRSEGEKEFLFALARELLKQYREKVLKENIRFIHLGRKDRFPQDIIDSINEIEELSKNKTDFSVGIALDYGGHDEIVRTISKLIEQGLEVSAENIENLLESAQLPKPDLIIRTGGEKRLSGFLSWQSAYAELYFTDKYFPDFDKEELKKALDDYATRERRFGGDSKKS